MNGSATILTPQGFADVLLGRRPREARAAALALLDAGVPPRAIYLQVLAPALEEVGVRWQRGIASVAEEHLATAVVSSIMATLAPQLDEPPPVARRAILASTDGELHVVGLRMVADFLEADGWEVLYLGAVTPAVDLVGLVHDTHPDAVCLSTTLTTHLEAVRATLALLRTIPDQPFIVVGGHAYGGSSAVAEDVGADAFAPDAGAASRLLRERFSDG